jgi:hypothetical protein
MATPPPRRPDPVTADLLRGVRRLNHAPLVEGARLRAAVYLLTSLPPLEYPINSAGELVGKYLTAGFRIKMGSAEIDPSQAIKYMPAHYFPIASPENFIEKIAELLKRSRVRLDAPAELSELEKQLPVLHYPIAGRSELIKQLSVKREYHFRGHVVDSSQAAKGFPKSYFPIRSQQDFHDKIVALITSRAGSRP